MRETREGSGWWARSLGAMRGADAGVSFGRGRLRFDSASPALRRECFGGLDTLRAGVAAGSGRFVNEPEKGHLCQELSKGGVAGHG